MRLAIMLLMSMSFTIMGAVVHVDKLTPTSVPKTGCVLEAVVTSEKGPDWRAGTYKIYACGTPDSKVQFCKQISVVKDVNVKIEWKDDWPKIAPNTVLVYSCMVNWTPE